MSDVIVSAYAAATVKKAGGVVQPVDAFAAPRPEVIHVSPSGSGSVPKQFGNTLKKFGNLEGVIRALGSSKQEVGRVALNTFSAGYALAKWALTSSSQAQVDAAVFIDSLAIDILPNGQFWVNDNYREFLRAAALGGPSAPLILSSCAKIPSLSKLVGSTAASTHWVLDQAQKWRADAGVSDRGPGFDLGRFNRPLARTVKITGGNPSSTQTWESWPTPEIRQVGNIVGFFFEDSGGPAHIFQAWHVQPRLWELLAQWWAPGPCEVSRNLDGTVQVSACESATHRRLSGVVSGSGRSSSSSSSSSKGGGSKVPIVLGLAAAVGLAIKAGKR